MQEYLFCISMQPINVLTAIIRNAYKYLRIINYNMISMKKTVKSMCKKRFGTNQEIYKLPNIQCQKIRTLKFLAIIKQYNLQISQKMLY